MEYYRRGYLYSPQRRQCYELFHNSLFPHCFPYCLQFCLPCCPCPLICLVFYSQQVINLILLQEYITYEVLAARWRSLRVILVSHVVLVTGIVRCSFIQGPFNTARGNISYINCYSPYMPLIGCYNSLQTIIVFLQAYLKLSILPRPVGKPIIIIIP